MARPAAWPLRLVTEGLRPDAPLAALYAHVRRCVMETLLPQSQAGPAGSLVIVLQSQSCRGRPHRRLRVGDTNI